jgi:hypothetical protein
MANPVKTGTAEKLNGKSWLAFLDTVRTERFEQVLALKDQLSRNLAA